MSEVPPDWPPDSLEPWSDWIPLNGPGFHGQVYGLPGLYRIRRTDDGLRLAYVGQTGGALRQRLGQLRGAYRPIIPYRDPHTAAPALWALRHRDRCEFEVSVAPVKGETPWRKALEATVITLCRLHTGQSPYVNFGRMPPGYRNSTGNNSRLIESGKRALGGPDRSAAVSAPSVPVNGDPLGDPESLDWMGWAWSDWVPLADTLGAADSVGLYRVRNEEVPGLVYVGQGKIAARLAAHLRKGHSPDHRQAAYFSCKVTASWLSLPNVPVVNLLEHENDLIAAHLLVTGAPPAAQFLG